MDVDLDVRLAAFQWLSDQVSIQGDVLPRELLSIGFDFHGERIPLVAPQGIFKPKILDLPLSITTTPHGPYLDSFGKDNLLTYRYRGNDPNHRDNNGLRRVFELKRPLAYFHGIVPGKYMAVWPVYIVGDDPANLMFKVALDDIASLDISPTITKQVSEGIDARRFYLTAAVKIRLHQRSFRERVLEAYQSQCAFCRLRHRELLDAAHIIPDSQPEGEPNVSNGLALCKLHHAAFDSFMLGVTPDYVIQVREDILAEDDGPVLQHGLKGLHQTRLSLPTLRNNWPSQEALEWRYNRFIRGI